MTLQKILTIAVLFCTTIFASAQGVIRPTQISKFDEIVTKKLNLNGGVFTAKTLQITPTTAKSGAIPSSLAVYNYVTEKAYNKSYSVVTDSTNATVLKGCTVFNFDTTQSTFTVTLPASPTAGDVVELMFNRPVTAVTVSAANTIVGTALTAASIGTSAVYHFIGNGINKWFRRN